MGKPAWMTQDWTQGELNALVKNLGEENARRIQRGEIKVWKKSNLLCVEQFFTPKPLIIGSTDGSRIITQARDVFTDSISPHFRKWKINKPVGPTNKTIMRAYKITRSTTYTEMFTSIDSDIRSLCMTPHQIIDFCQEYFEWTVEYQGRSTIFLVKSNGFFFVPHVFWNHKGLSIGINEYSSALDWRPDYNHRLLIVPYRVYLSS